MVKGKLAVISMDGMGAGKLQEEFKKKLPGESFAMAMDDLRGDIGALTRALRQLSRLAQNNQPPEQE